MSEIKHPAHLEEEKNPVAEIKNAWDRYGKTASYILLVIVLIAGGIYAYQSLIAGPKEQQAAEAMFRAQQYYQQDSTPAGPQRGQYQCRFPQDHLPLWRHQVWKARQLLRRKLLSEAG